MEALVNVLKRSRVWLVAILLGAVVRLGAQQPPSGFVPMNELPPSEQLPAAPLLITAYAFVWIAVMLYVWSVWRRLVRVEGELTALEQRVKK
jgi:CcmD family protein